jgi:hypothetical protein
VSLTTDIAALKARCTALEKRATSGEARDKAQDASIALLRKEVDELKYIIRPRPNKYLAALASSFRATAGSAVLGTTGGAEVFNVMDYRAGVVINTGVNNAATAFMAAIAAAVAAGGGTVYAPAGTYRMAPDYGGTNAPNGSCKGCLYLPSNVTLLGDGPTTILQDRSSTNSVSCIIATVETNISVKNLAIDVDAAHQAANADCIKFMGCNNATIENVVGAGASIGLNFSGSSYCTFTDVHMHSCWLPFSGRTTAWCSGITGGADYMDIQTVTFTRCAAGPAANNVGLGGFNAYKDYYHAGEMAAAKLIANLLFDTCESYESSDVGMYITHNTHPTFVSCNIHDNGSEGLRIRDSTQYWFPQSPTTGFNYGTGNGGAFLLAQSSTARGSL